MHAEAYEFVQETLASLAPIRGATVIEIGSYIVNGSVRPLFSGCAHYLGVDVRPGPGVQLVGHMADLDDQIPAGWANIVVTTEALEHDPRPEATIAAALRALAPGGYIIITAAAPERAPHSCDGHTYVPDGEHYGNIAPDDLERWLQAGCAMGDVLLRHYADRGDLYAVARRAVADA